MGAPHNAKRYGETWNSAELALMQQEIEAVQDLVVISGGAADGARLPEDLDAL